RHEAANACFIRTLPEFCNIVYVFRILFDNSSGNLERLIGWLEGDADSFLLKVLCKNRNARKYRVQRGQALLTIDYQQLRNLALVTSTNLAGPYVSAGFPKH